MNALAGESPTLPRLAPLLPRDLFTRSLGLSLAAIGAVWAGIVCCWLLVGWAGTAWSVLPAALLIGTLQYHLNILGHDGLHFLLCDSRPVNDALCRWLLHGPHGAPLAQMRRNHLNHHTAFGTDSDHDRQYYDTTRFRSAVAFRVWLFGSLLGGMTLPIIAKLLGLGRRDGATAAPAPAAAPGNPTDWLSVAGSQAWIAMAIFVATGWWHGYLWLWLLPMLTVMVGLNTMRSCLEHGQAGSREPRLFSVQSHPLESFFLSPFHMNIHAEHHLVPAVPWHKLPALRRIVQQGEHEVLVQRVASYMVRQRQLAGAITAQR